MWEEWHSLVSEKRNFFLKNGVLDALAFHSAQQQHKRQLERTARSFRTDFLKIRAFSSLLDHKDVYAPLERRKLAFCFSEWQTYTSCTKFYSL